MAAVKVLLGGFYGFLWCFSAASTMASQQHGNSHGAYPTGDRREPPCHRGNALKVHITAKFPCCIAIHSYINDYRTGFNHLPGDKPSLAHSGNQNIRPAGHLRQILGPAVANSNGSIAVQCQSAMGFPTILLRPMMTHSLPAMSTPVLSMRVRIPLGVQGAKK